MICDFSAFSVSFSRNHPYMDFRYSFKHTYNYEQEKAIIKVLYRLITNSLSTQNIVFQNLQPFYKMNSSKHLRCLYITVHGFLLNYLSLFVILYFLKTKFLFMLTSPFNEGKGDVWTFFNKALIYWTPPPTNYKFNLRNIEIPPNLFKFFFYWL